MAEAVADGAYASSGEIIRDALSLREAREVERRQEQRRLKAAYDDGIASGEGRRIDVATLLAELKSEARASG